MRANINLSDLIEKEIGKLAAHFQLEKKHVLQLDVEPGIYFMTDAFAFVSILSNLYENAIKYSASEPILKISLRKMDEQLELLFEDNGIGISESETLLIFDKFYRVGSEETRKNKGTGLGLYIVRQLVKNHNGTIKVRKNSSKGSIFEITLNT